jgi:hypothetical protein
VDYICRFIFNTVSAGLQYETTHATSRISNKSVYFRAAKFPNVYYKRRIPRVVPMKNNRRGRYYLPSQLMCLVLPANLMGLHTQLTGTLSKTRNFTHESIN